MEALRVLIGRIAGAVAAGLLTWLGAKLGVEFSPNDHAALAGVIVTAVFLGYSLVHRAIAAKANPADAAKPAVAKAVEAAHAPGVTDNRTINITAPAGSDPKALAAEVRRILADDDRARHGRLGGGL